MGNKNSTSNQGNAQNSLGMRRNLNWNLIQKLQHRQTLKSKRTELIIERHHYKTELFECFDEESKLFDWRNKNPNHQYIVSVLSTHHEVTQQSMQDFSDCGQYTGICPGKEKQVGVFVVTERILRVSQFPQFLRKSNQEISISQKFSPFQDLNLSRIESRRIFKDWIRGIQILCYKFGYFIISQQHLGITAHKRGNVWMNQNYALNCFELKKRVNVTTAQQKFKYEKEVIVKVISFVRNIEWFNQIEQQIKDSDLQTFQQILQNVVQEKGSNKSRKRSMNHTRNNSAQQIHEHRKSSSNFIVKPNSSNMNKVKQLSQEYAFESHHRKNLVNSSNKDSHIPHLDILELKRANTNENKEGWMNIQDEICLNSIHKITNKDTAPTLEMGHSSSLHSINNRNNYSIMNNQNTSILDRNNISQQYLYKSHNNSNELLMNKKGPASNLYRFGHMPSPTRKQSQAAQKQFFYHNVSTPDALMFRSLEEEEKKKKKSPREERCCPHHNMSMDHSIIVGPYRKDKIYSNFKKQNIALVDSMVMVQEQNQDYESQFHRQNSNIVLEESIILRGRHEENLHPHPSHIRHGHSHNNQLRIA